MRETFRDVEHFAVFSRQLYPYPLLGCLRVTTQVNSYIVDRSSGATNQFRLGVGLVLKVHAPQGTFSHIEGNVALKYARIESMLLKLFFTPASREEAPLI